MMFFLMFSNKKSPVASPRQSLCVPGLATGYQSLLLTTYKEDITLYVKINYMVTSNKSCKSAVANWRSLSQSCCVYPDPMFTNHNFWQVVGEESLNIL